MSCLFSVQIGLFFLMVYGFRSCRANCHWPASFVNRQRYHDLLRPPSTFANPELIWSTTRSPSTFGTLSIAVCQSMHPLILLMNHCFHLANDLCLDRLLCQLTHHCQTMQLLHRFLCPIPSKNPQTELDHCHADSPTLGT